MLHITILDYTFVPASSKEDDADHLLGNSSDKPCDVVDDGSGVVAAAAGDDAV